MNDYEEGREEYGYTEYPEKSSTWKIWLVVLVPLLIIVLVLGIFIFRSVSTNTISDAKFVEGATLDLKENKEASFTVGDEKHFLKINSVGLDSAKIVIQSEPIELELKAGEEREVDITGDGLIDVIVKLVEIKDGVPRVYMRRIYEIEKQKFEIRKNETIERARERFSEGVLPDLERRIRNASVDDLKELENIVNNSLNSSVSFEDNSDCIGTWYCGPWRECRDGEQTRDCSDFNSCGIIQEKPTMRRNCTLSTPDINSTCHESWKCGDWKECIEGIQKRDCVDLNHCGSELSEFNRIRNCSIDEGSDVNNNCTENWECGVWNQCTNGKQTRICEDKHNCGSVLNKPEIEKNCEQDSAELEIKRKEILNKARELLPEEEFLILKEPIANATTIEELEELNQVIENHLNALSTVNQTD